MPKKIPVLLPEALGKTGTTGLQMSGKLVPNVKGFSVL